MTKIGERLDKIIESVKLPPLGEIADLAEENKLIYRTSKSAIDYFVYNDGKNTIKELNNVLTKNIDQSKFVALPFYRLSKKRIPLEKYLDEISYLLLYEIDRKYDNIGLITKKMHGPDERIKMLTLSLAVGVDWYRTQIEEDGCLEEETINNERILSLKQ